MVAAVSASVRPVLRADEQQPAVERMHRERASLDIARQALRERLPVTAVRGHPEQAAARFLSAAGSVIVVAAGKDMLRSPMDQEITSAQERHER
ncbi:MAG: hypothetical protein AB7L76_01345 [Burkholderiaceae bacterium]